MACTITGLEPLDVRREMLCLNFARKNLKSSEPLFMIPSKMIILEVRVPIRGI